MFTNVPDSPQSVGDIVGLACRLTRGNLKLLFNFLLWPTVLAAASGVAFQWIFTYGVSSIAETRNVSAAFALAGVWFVGAIVVSIAMWILQLRMLALLRLALGFSPDLADANANVNGKKWSVLGVYVLCLLVFGIVMAALGVVAGVSSLALSFLPGFSILMFALCGVGIVFASIVFMLVVHISLSMVACESVSATNVIGRTLRLTFKHLWRMLAFGSVFGLTYFILTYPTMVLPISILSFGDAVSHGLATLKSSSGYKAPLWVLVIAQVWESAMTIYFRPLTTFAFGLFYWDMLMRSEGLDMSRRIQKMIPVEVVDSEF